MLDFFVVKGLVFVCYDGATLTFDLLASDDASAALEK